MALKECAMERALKKYLLMDASKLFVKGFFGLLRSEDFDAVICNQDSLLDPGELPDNFILTK